MLRRRVMGGDNPLSGKTAPQIAEDIDALVHIIKNDALSKKWEPLLQGYGETIKETLKKTYPCGSYWGNVADCDSNYDLNTSSFNCWDVEFPTSLTDLDGYELTPSSSAQYPYSRQDHNLRINYKTGVSLRGHGFYRLDVNQKKTKKYFFNSISIPKD